MGQEFGGACGSQVDQHVEIVNTRTKDDLMAQFDVLVIGNGVLGLFLANELSARSVGTIGVVGPQDRRLGASVAASAMLGCFGEMTRETLASSAGRAKFELGLTAHRRWPSVLDELQSEVSTSEDDSATRLRLTDDTFVVLNAHGGDLDSINFDAMLSALDEYGEPWSEAVVTDIEGYAPRPDGRALRVAHLPREGAVDSHRVLAAMEVRLRRRGVEFVDGEVSVLITQGEAVVGAELSNGARLHAGTVVVASGASSGPLLESTCGPGETVPMYAGLGVAMVGKRPPGPAFRSVVRTPNRAFACGLHVVPMGSGREYLGATNAVVGTPKDRPFLGDLHFLADCAIRQLDEKYFHFEVEQWRVGNRPVTLDGFPLIGWSARPGMYVLTGTYRDGFHGAPLLAEHAADQIEGKSGILGDLFAPHRSPIRTRTVEESVDEFVRHRIAAWFEAGAQAPPQVSATALAQSFAAQAWTLYDKFGIDHGIGPDMLMYLTTSLTDQSAVDTIRYLRKRRTSAEL